jgi:hypothetical protein
MGFLSPVYYWSKLAFNRTGSQLKLTYTGRCGLVTHSSYIRREAVNEIHVGKVFPLMWWVIAVVSILIIGAFWEEEDNLSKGISAWAFVLAFAALVIALIKMAKKSLILTTSSGYFVSTACCDIDAFGSTSQAGKLLAWHAGEETGFLLNGAAPSEPMSIYSQPMTVVNQPMTIMTQSEDDAQLTTV